MLGLPLPVDRQLVGGDERQAAPGQERRAEQPDGRRRHAAAGALAAERGDGARMRQEERRLLPDLGDELVEVVGRGRALARLDALRVDDVVQQAVVRVVDELALLALLDLLDESAAAARWTWSCGLLYRSETRVWTSSTVVTALSEYSRGFSS